MRPASRSRWVCAAAWGEVIGGGDRAREVPPLEISPVINRKLGRLMWPRCRLSH
jgi:hypothetical protein